MSLVRKTVPKFSMAFSAISFLLRVLSFSSTASTTSSATFSLWVTKKAPASSSCSAWERRSVATQSGFAVSSAITRISLGPATMSMSTVPKRNFFARATYMFPGPTILSTFGMLSVPKAMAATPWAPPTL